MHLIDWNFQIKRILCYFFKCFCQNSRTYLLSPLIYFKFSFLQKFNAYFVFNSFDMCHHKLLKKNHYHSGILLSIPKFRINTILNVESVWLCWMKNGYVFFYFWNIFIITSKFLPIFVHCSFFQRKNETRFCFIKSESSSSD